MIPLYFVSSVWCERHNDKEVSSNGLPRKCSQYDGYDNYDDYFNYSKVRQQIGHFVWGESYNLKENI
jgi:hypothetical protein